MKGILVATSFLTQIPVPGAGSFSGEDVGRAQTWFPAVGAAIGAVSVGVPLALSWILPGDPPSLVLAVMSVVIYAWVTGALHLDAIADVTDGFGGGRDRDQVISIMRDSLIGAYGAVALVLVLALRIAALDALFQSGPVLSFAIAAGALSRASSVALGFALPNAGSGQGKNLGAASTDHGGRLTCVLAVGSALAIACVAGAPAAAAMAVVGLWAFACSRRYLARIGGVTGDCLGATSEGAEVLALTVGAMCRVG